MFSLFCFVLAVLASPFKSKSRLEAENAALRRQLVVLRRKVQGRIRLRNNDRWFLIQLYRWFPSILQVITIVQPETLVRWHRAGFRYYWRWKSRPRGGRPQIETDLRALICVVLVATIRALKMHGGVKKEDLKAENLKALEAGMANLQRHVENVQKFGIVPVVSINRFSADTDAEIDLVKKGCAKLGVEAIMADHWAEGGKGAEDVARALVKIVDSGKSKLKPLYPDDTPLIEKIRTIAKEIYRAKDITADKPVRDQLARFESMGFGKAPVCIAKTQYSFTTNPDSKGAPNDHVVNVREVRLSAGAEFVVAICGEIMTMPGLPRVPSADSIDVKDGRIVGLF
jgi:formyltetrahydrofolate synthetase